MQHPERIPVLMYHRVGTPDHSRDIYCIHPDRFSAHMRGLANAGYRSVSIEDFDSWRRGDKFLPKGAFLLTFDDGFAGVYDYAAPVLREMGWAATVFLVAGKLGGQSDWQLAGNDIMHPHPLMNKEQLHSLAAQGFSLQSHSLRHHDLTTLDTDALMIDLIDSRKCIAAISGQPPAFLAYPYGRHNEMVRVAAKATGFVSAFSVETGFNRPSVDPFRIRRLDIFGSDTTAMLLRKIRLGSNDGSLIALAKYYSRRLFQAS